MMKSIKRAAPLLSATLLIAVCAVCVGCRDERVSVICFGDSATIGNPPDDTYPLYLEELLLSGGGCAGPGCVANQGQGGDTACGSLQRLLSATDPAEFPNTENLIYWLGGNDMLQFLAREDVNPQLAQDPEQWELDYIRNEIVFGCIADELNALQNDPERSHLEIYLGTYFHPISHPSKLFPFPNGYRPLTTDEAGRAAVYVDAMNDAIYELAELPRERPIRGVAAIGELRVLCGGDPDCYKLNDAIHPQLEGYREIAQKWYEALSTPKLALMPE